MIDTSAEYQELMQSNIRPKCEPRIVVSGIGNRGQNVSLTWNANNITGMTYKRGIDPVGRSLPYMELTWTEIYTGKLNAQGEPDKYNNIVKYMEVELSFVQNLGFYNTWKNIKQLYWSDLKLANSSWRFWKNNVAVETITMPKMYLTARPSIEGQTITWTARDLLSFLDETQTKDFGDEYLPINYINPLIYFVQNARGSFLNAPKIFDALTQTATNLSNKGYAYGQLDKKVIFNAATKDDILNYANLRNLHIDFKENYFDIKDMPSWTSADADNIVKFSKNIMYEYPKITNGTNISAYVFKNYVAERDTGSTYQSSYSSSVTWKGATYYRWNFKGYGAFATPYTGIYEINYGISNDSTDKTIIPINYNGYDNIINNSSETVGETFVEDNPINPYDSYSTRAQNRFEALTNYFNGDNSAIEFTGLANPAIETGDIIEVETNLYTDASAQSENIIKTAVVVEQEITYNGAIREKIIAHELQETGATI